MLLRYAIVAALLFLSVASGQATVWFVNEDGTGDAPSIQAAFVSASAGDTILVGPGTYYEGDIFAFSDIYLFGQEGPLNTIIDCGGSEFGIYSLIENAPKQLIGFTFKNASRGAMHYEGGGSDVLVKDCVAYDCSVGFYGHDLQGLVENVTVTKGFKGQWSGSGFSFSYSSVTIRQCVSAFNEGAGFIQWAGPTLQIECCDAYENLDGNYVGFSDPTGTNGNISADPLFCDFDGNDLRLSPGSPCLPLAAGLTCRRMGALPAGCDGLVDGGAGPESRIVLPVTDRSVRWIAPSPFTTSAIALALPSAQNIRVEIWDVAGRKLGQTSLGHVSNGRTVVETDRLIPSRAAGILFLRVYGEGWSESLKVPVIK